MGSEISPLFFIKSSTALVNPLYSFIWGKRLLKGSTSEERTLLHFRSDSPKAKGAFVVINRQTGTIDSVWQKRTPARARCADLNRKVSGRPWTVVRILVDEVMKYLEGVA